MTYRREVEFERISQFGCAKIYMYRMFIWANYRCFGTPNSLLKKKSTKKKTDFTIMHSDSTNHIRRIARSKYEALCVFSAKNGILFGISRLLKKIYIDTKQIHTKNKTIHRYICKIDNA